MEKFTFAGDRYTFNSHPDSHRKRAKLLDRNLKWNGVHIKWTGTIKDGKHIVQADAGSSPWRMQGECVVASGYHLVDACDTIISSWLDTF